MPNSSPKEKEKLNKTNDYDFSINNFTISWHDITLPTEIRNQMKLDIPFLTYSLKEIDYYIKFFKSKHYPFYAALALDAKNVKLSKELTQNL